MIHNSKIKITHVFQKVIIAAVGQQRELGIRGDLIWHLPGDLRHFKRTTLGAPVVMGRNTWESLPKRPLPGRLNIVITTRPDYHAEGAVTAPSLQEAIRIAETQTPDDTSAIFIIGGASVYQQAIDLADSLIITQVEAIEPRADVLFPEIDKEVWSVIDTSEPMTENGITYRFVTYIRK